MAWGSIPPSAWEPTYCWHACMRCAALLLVASRNDQHEVRGCRLLWGVYMRWRVLGAFDWISVAQCRCIQDSMCCTPCACRGRARTGHSPSRMHVSHTICLCVQQPAASASEEKKCAYGSSERAEQRPQSGERSAGWRARFGFGDLYSGVVTVVCKQVSRPHNIDFVIVFLA